MLFRSLSGKQKNGSVLRRPVFILPSANRGPVQSPSVDGLGLGKAVEDLLTGFPASVGGKEVDPLETLEDISFFPDGSGAFQTGMSGHFFFSAVMFIRCVLPQQ